MRAATRATARPRVGLLVGLLVAGLLLPGCSFIDRFREPHDRLSSEYRASLARWTRAGEVPDALILRLGVSAVLLTPSLRADAAAEARRVLDLAPGESTPLGLEGGAGPGEIELLVAVAAPSRREADLADSEPVWRMSLRQGEAVHVAPSYFHSIKESSPLRGLFPFAEPWDRLYQVTFAAPGASLAEGAPPVRVTLAGVHGQVDLEWTL